VGLTHSTGPEHGTINRGLIVFMEESKFAVATVLIIDNDLGFIFWLGKILGEAGYLTLPAKEVSGAVELLSEYKTKADLLVIDPSLPGALDVISTLRRSHATLAVIASSDQSQETLNLPGVDRTLPKPGCSNEALRLKWLGTIQSLLGRYSARA
jgi:CheY-like chemotaxis protein